MAFALQLNWKRGFVVNADLRSLHKLMPANPNGQLATCVIFRHLAELSLGEWLRIIIEEGWSRVDMAGITGIENVYFAKNVSSALSTANVIGTVGLTADQTSKSCV